MSDKEGFLGRWSRLKEAGLEPSPDAPLASAPPEVVDERDDEEILADLGLPHPDELLPGDDIKGFMQQAVPGRLRRLALRKLWASNPVLANVDGLIDYGDDFTDSATVVENLQTLYEVGKGMWSDVVGEENEGEAASPKSDIPPEVAAEPVAPTPAPAPDDVIEYAPASEGAEPDGTTEAIVVEAQADVAPTRRRMKFS